MQSGVAQQKCITISNTKKKINIFIKSILANKVLYLIFLPVFLYFLIFKYLPMFGLIIAFENYNPGRGFFASQWVGLQHFKDFFTGTYFWRLIRNTLAIEMLGIVFGFPAPIILALLLNEVNRASVKRLVQTITYLPHFISTVIIVSMLINFLSPDAGLINNIIAMAGGEKIFFMADPKYFWWIYTFKNLWKDIGWGSIIYIASISGIDIQLYEAAIMDGAGKWRQMWHVTLPGISPTIVVLLILRLGRMLDVGAETIILMYNPRIYETADVISSYVYRKGLQEVAYSFSTAVGMFQSAIGLILVVLGNQLSRKISETSLW